MKNMIKFIKNYSNKDVLYVKLKFNNRIHKIISYSYVQLLLTSLIDFKIQ